MDTGDRQRGRPIWMSLRLLLCSSTRGSQINGGAVDKVMKVCVGDVGPRSSSSVSSSSSTARAVDEEGIWGSFANAGGNGDGENGLSGAGDASPLTDAS